jgi:hypothetical protein
MPGPRLPMRKIRDVLRLSGAGLGWPLPEGLADEALERRLYPPAVAAKDRRPQPNWAAVHRELRRPGVTLQLLWEEHRAVHPNGYGYSRYCELYRTWEARLSPTMRQSHIAGERMFVDYAGTTLEVIDPSTGEAMTAQLFVAVLGASNYTYAEATWNSACLSPRLRAGTRHRVRRRGKKQGGSGEPPCCCVGRAPTSHQSQRLTLRTSPSSCSMVTVRHPPNRPRS